MESCISTIDNLEDIEVWQYIAIDLDYIDKDEFEKLNIESIFLNFES